MTATSPAASPTTSLTARQSQPTSPAARPVSPAALEAAAWQERLELAAIDARVVTGDDGLDHYL